MFTFQVYSLEEIQVKVEILTLDALNDKFCRLNGIDNACARRLKRELVVRPETSNGELLCARKLCKEVEKRIGVKAGSFFR